MNRALATTVVFFTLLAAMASYACSEGLPNYINWQNKFSVTSKVSFGGTQIDADITMYFNNAVPREASQIVADITVKIDGSPQHYVQYVAIQHKDVAANRINFDAELYQADADKMLFRGAVNLTMPIEKFYQDMMISEPIQYRPEDYEY